MITVRPSHQRGHVVYDWLDTKHTFSFDRYYDPAHMGFRALRVINEDVIAAGQGFGTHPHRDMEIITYVVSGALEHKDSMGNGSVIRPGDIQQMSAGTGITHSEFNPSPDEPVHLLQIWIVPDEPGHAPKYGQITVGDAERRNRLYPAASGSDIDGAIPIHQDTTLFVSRCDTGTDLHYDLTDGRHAWLQLVAGAVSVNGTTLEAGDGAAISGETRLAIHATREAEFLLFDLA